ncbi:MAG TPA: DNA mismatch repair endonuclease MutL, partial [Dongiaceae bacterium]|nr:DNA mismatch repair endonuclease MutL [Dongiaceae bacterium]
MLAALMSTGTTRVPIRRLSADTASRIAAGEVIERPLSALKEILENALDAGSRRVDVRVERQLDHSFSVADDGGGIADDELELALERHATSKIAALDDLDRLATLGFRGEALPSIAAVSRIRITSRPAGSDAATTLVAEGGNVIGRGPASRAPGTTVEVRDLFFNTPARRKFLHSPTGELRAAIRLIETYGLGYPEVAFRLTVDERQRLEWPAARAGGVPGRVERAAMMWGADHAAQRRVVEDEKQGVRLTALVGLPEHARATREGQCFLVNRRVIQSPVLSQALRQAYGNLLPAGRFPAAVLWLEVPPARLDVNVHPTKREVRFADEDTVFSLVAGACARSLADLQPPFRVVSGGATGAERRWSDRVREGPREQTDLGFETPSAPASATVSAAAPETVVSEPELWQLHRTYVLAPVRGGLVIVDQHAAHERILFEEALKRLEGRRGASQQLLFPALVDLTPDQWDLLLELGPWLTQLGWDLSMLGPPTVVIQGMPSVIAHPRPGQLLQDLIDGVAEDTARGADDDIAERVARSYACHAATRAGDPLTQEEMRTLVDRLFATTRPHGDPHGRPT